MLDEQIYGIMVTGKDTRRQDLARRSVESFLEQSYPHRELLVVNDGPFELAQDFGDCIREIRPAHGSTLGELRNLALAQVPDGAIWVQWDDDDWHHSALIDQQYQRLLEHSADAVVLQQQIQYAVSHDAAWVERRNGIEGTIMCRKRDVLYPTLARGEDTRFLKDYSAHHRTVAWANEPRAYIRLIHGSNTWDDEHFGLNARRAGVWDLDPGDAAYLREVLARYSFPRRSPSNDGDPFHAVIPRRR